MQELEKILDKIESEHPYKVPGDSNSYSQYNEGWCDCVDRVRKELKDVEKNDMREHELTKIVNEICQNTFFMNDDNIVKDKDRDENELCISFSKLKEILSKYAFCKSNPDDWIPVDEKLPEESEEFNDVYDPVTLAVIDTEWHEKSDIVQVTVYDRDEEKYFTYVDNTYNGEWVTFNLDNFKVIAWKPLSDPYIPEPLETRKNSKGARKNE